MHTMTKQSDIQHLQQRLRDRARQVHELEETIVTLRAELAASMLPYKGHVTHVVDGVRVITMGSGEVYRYVQNCVATETSTEYRWEWERMDPVPGSPAARIAGLLEATATRHGMECYDEEALAS